MHLSGKSPPLLKCENEAEIMFRRGLTLDERLHRALQDRGMEWFSAAVMVAWAVTLALPGNTLDGSNFAAFHRYPWMTEIFWAVMFGVIGGARLLALYINGHSPRSPYARMIGSLFGALSWGQVSLLITEGTYGTTGVASTGTGVYALLAVADLISVYRAAHDARYQPT
jgi:hypothetical protein